METPNNHLPMECGDNSKELKQKPEITTITLHETNGESYWSFYCGKKGEPWNTQKTLKHISETMARLTKLSKATLEMFQDISDSSNQKTSPSTVR